MKNNFVLIISLFILLIPEYISADSSSNVGFGEYHLGEKRKGNGIKTPVGYLETKNPAVTIRGVKCRAEVTLMSTLDTQELYRIEANIHKNGNSSGCNLTNEEIADALQMKYNPMPNMMPGAGKDDFGRLYMYWSVKNYHIYFIFKNTDNFSPVTIKYLDINYKAEDKAWEKIKEKERWNRENPPPGDI